MAPEVKKLGLKGIFLTIGGINNRTSDPEFDAIFEAEMQKLIQALQQTSWKADPILQGYRKLHESIHRSNQRFVSASENLLSSLLRNHHASRINLLVDIYNMVSMKTRLAFGAHDLAKTQGNIVMRMTTGKESFYALGAPTPTTVGPGEYGYLDESGEVICRLEVRQCERTKVTVDTKECFFIIQGNAATSEATLKAAGDELVALSTRFCGGKVRWISVD